MRPVKLSLGLMMAMCACTLLRADPAVDLARIHTEAIGGAARLQQWQAMRATGQVLTGGRELAFELVAARPNRVRVVIRSEGRELWQATDGRMAWQQEVGAASRQPRVMPGVEARGFLADAEFDDPLASTPDRGYRLDYAGETRWRDQRVLKVLVTRSGEEPSFLLVDSETYFILAKVTKQSNAAGRRVTIETRFDDFRPVAGVILPHDIQVFEDGRLLRQTVLGHVLPIMEPPAETFAIPAEGLAAVAEMREREG